MYIGELEIRVLISLLSCPWLNLTSHVHTELEYRIVNHVTKYPSMITLFIDRCRLMCSHNDCGIIKRRYTGEDWWNICETTSIIVPPIFTISLYIHTLILLITLFYYFICIIDNYGFWTTSGLSEKIRCGSTNRFRSLLAW
jgi:hypothetical protein